MNARKHSICILAILLSGALAGCQAFDSTDPLEGTSWALASIDGALPLPGRTITLAFEEGDIQGSSGCNSYFGSYTVSGDRLTLADLLWTEMACVEPGWMEQETAYLAHLSAVDGFALRGGQLELSSGGAIRLVFDPQL